MKTEFIEELLYFEIQTFQWGKIVNLPCEKVWEVFDTCKRNSGNVRFDLERKQNKNRSPEAKTKKKYKKMLKLL